jgi:hypothetical protein
MPAGAFTTITAAQATMAASLAVFYATEAEASQERE